MAGPGRPRPLGEANGRRLFVGRPTRDAAGSAAQAAWLVTSDVVAEVAKPTDQRLGEDRVARAANQAASGRPGAIAGLGDSLESHLVRSRWQPIARAAPGQLPAELDNVVAPRVRGAVNTVTPADSCRARVTSPRPVHAIGDGIVWESGMAARSLVASRGGPHNPGWGRGPVAPRVPVTPWGQNTWLPDQGEIESQQLASSHSKAVRPTASCQSPSS